MRRRLCALVLAVLLPLVAGVAPIHAQQPCADTAFPFFDQNGDGIQTATEPLQTNVAVAITGNGRRYSAVSDTSGVHFSLPPGAYSRTAQLVAPGGQVALAAPPRTVIVTDHCLHSGPELPMTLPPTPHDAHYFPASGYRIDNDLIWHSFQARGGIDTFGYPVSRTFPFLRFWTQIFQRQIIQLGGPSGDQPGVMNLLDPGTPEVPGLLPVTSVNFSTFPAFAPTLAAQAPPVGSPTYARDVTAFVQQHVPDQFAGLPVRFYGTFLGGASNPLPGLALSGLPTGQPAVDPNNHDFVYQRFQRGVMHYDAGCRCTGGILLADTFKSVLLAGHPGLAAPPPPDVVAQLQDSPYLGLYDPHPVDAVSLLKAGTQNIPRAGGTDMAFAFRTDRANAPPLK
ncbi:MAG: hypothetical protein ACR2JY_23570 [Chloroflexota bacterium]